MSMVDDKNAKSRANIGESEDYRPCLIPMSVYMILTDQSLTLMPNQRNVIVTMNEYEISDINPNHPCDDANVPSHVIIFCIRFVTEEKFQPIGGIMTYRNHNQSEVLAECLKAYINDLWKVGLHVMGTISPASKTFKDIMRHIVKVDDLDTHSGVISYSVHPFKELIHIYDIQFLLAKFQNLFKDGKINYTVTDDIGPEKFQASWEDMSKVFSLYDELHMVNSLLDGLEDVTRKFHVFSEKIYRFFKEAEFLGVLPEKSAGCAILLKCMRAFLSFTEMDFVQIDNNLSFMNDWNYLVDILKSATFQRPFKFPEEKPPAAQPALNPDIKRKIDFSNNEEAPKPKSPEDESTKKFKGKRKKRHARLIRKDSPVGKPIKLVKTEQKPSSTETSEDIPSEKKETGDQESRENPQVPVKIEAKKTESHEKEDTKIINSPQSPEEEKNSPISCVVSDESRQDPEPEVVENAPRKKSPVKVLLDDSEFVFANTLLNANNYRIDSKSGLVKTNEDGTSEETNNLINVKKDDDANDPDPKQCEPIREKETVTDVSPDDSWDSHPGFDPDPRGIFESPIDETKILAKTEQSNLSTKSKIKSPKKNRELFDTDQDSREISEKQEEEPKKQLSETPLVSKETSKITEEKPEISEKTEQIDETQTTDELKTPKILKSLEAIFSDAFSQTVRFEQSDMSVPKNIAFDESINSDPNPQEIPNIPEEELKESENTEQSPMENIKSPEKVIMSKESSETQQISIDPKEIPNIAKDESKKCKNTEKNNISPMENIQSPEKVKDTEIVISTESSESQNIASDPDPNRITKIPEEELKEDEKKEQSPTKSIKSPEKVRDTEVVISEESSEIQQISKDPDSKEIPNIAEDELKESDNTEPSPMENIKSPEKVIDTEVIMSKESSEIQQISKDPDSKEIPNIAQDKSKKCEYIEEMNISPKKNVKSPEKVKDTEVVMSTESSETQNISPDPDPNRITEIPEEELKKDEKKEQSPTKNLKSPEIVRDTEVVISEESSEIQQISKDPDSKEIPNIAEDKLKECKDTEEMNISPKKNIESPKRVIDTEVIMSKESSETQNIALDPDPNRITKIPEEELKEDEKKERSPTKSIKFPEKVRDTEVAVSEKPSETKHLSIDPDWKTISNIAEDESKECEKTEELIVSPKKSIKSPEKVKVAEVLISTESSDTQNIAPDPDPNRITKIPEEELKKEPTKNIKSPEKIKGTEVVISKGSSETQHVSIDTDSKEIPNIAEDKSEECENTEQLNISPKKNIESPKRVKDTEVIMSKESSEIQHTSIVTDSKEIPNITEDDSKECRNTEKLSISPRKNIKSPEKVKDTEVVISTESSETQNITPDPDPNKITKNPEEELKKDKKKEQSSTKSIKSPEKVKDTEVIMSKELSETQHISINPDLKAIPKIPENVSKENENTKQLNISPKKNVKSPKRVEDTIIIIPESPETQQISLDPDPKETSKMPEDKPEAKQLNVSPDKLADTLQFLIDIDSRRQIEEEETKKSSMPLKTVKIESPLKKRDEELIISDDSQETRITFDPHQQKIHISTTKKVESPKTPTETKLVREDSETFDSDPVGIFKSPLREQKKSYQLVCPDESLETQHISFDPDPKDDIEENESETLRQKYHSPKKTYKSPKEAKRRSNEPQDTQHVSFDPDPKYDQEIPEKDKSKNSKQKYQSPKKSNKSHKKAERGSDEPQDTQHVSFDPDPKYDQEIPEEDKSKISKQKYQSPKKSNKSHKKAERASDEPQDTQNISFDPDPKEIFKIPEVEPRKYAEIEQLNVSPQENINSPKSTTEREIIISSELLETRITYDLDPTKIRISTMRKNKSPEVQAISPDPKEIDENKQSQLSPSKNIKSPEAQETASETGPREIDISEEETTAISEKKSTSTNDDSLDNSEKTVEQPEEKGAIPKKGILREPSDEKSNTSRAMKFHEIGPVIEAQSEPRNTGAIPKKTNAARAIVYNDAGEIVDVCDISEDLEKIAKMQEAEGGKKTRRDRVRESKQKAKAQKAALSKQPDRIPEAAGIPDNPESTRTLQYSDEIKPYIITPSGETIKFEMDQNVHSNPEGVENKNANTQSEEDKSYNLTMSYDEQSTKTQESYLRIAQLYSLLRRNADTPNAVVLQEKDISLMKEVWQEGNLSHNDSSGTRKVPNLLELLEKEFRNVYKPLDESGPVLFERSTVTNDIVCTILGMQRMLQMMKNRRMRRVRTGAFVVEHIDYFITRVKEKNAFHAVKYFGEKYEFMNNPLAFSTIDTQGMYEVKKE